MQNITFITGSNNIHLYYWKCIEQILMELPHVQITIYSNEKYQYNEVFTFNKWIDYLDSKFSNFKLNPLQKVDIQQKTNEYQQIKIKTHFKDLNQSDWIVFEKPWLDVSAFSKYTKNGFLALNIHYLENIKAVLNNIPSVFSVLYRTSTSQNWNNIETVQFNTEIGIKNNTHKITFNAAIYVLKFLKNQENIKRDASEKLQNFASKYHINLSLKLKIIFYYLGLCFKILCRKLSSQQLNWKLAIKKNDIVTFIKQPIKSFWADPFIINDPNGNTVIYFEELKKDGLGKISCIVLNENLEITQKEDILNTTYHLSFPNVFSVDKQYYMIPESSQNNTLQLYKCTKFPFQWEFQHHVMEHIKLLDAVWIYHNNLYWIFANKIEDFEYDNNEKLYAYYANDLFSTNWQPHSKNPIVTDASLARNAGNFLFENNQLYRVSQNCKNGYGKNLVFNEVKLLSTTEYVEVKVNEHMPPNKFVGMHTLNKNNNLEVFDVLTLE
ncbi:hypothetical protein ACFQ1R_01010 [Mariniflexile jejuense]|uniref:Glucosamine inositolphosphorylceramide transferase 1 N-terminal domain-containing protein n=1 Tax=Mariniflexile jejuense TaxID=1173582 RepID=A0ABW3JF16_9FLAO